MFKRDKLEKLFARLATDKEMQINKAPVVYHKNKPGNLSAYDAGLGFTWISLDGKEQKPELTEHELSLMPNTNVENLEAGTVIVATYGHNTVLDKPFEFLYEFGYYFGYNTKSGCVVYNQGECNMQDAHAFKLDQIRIATPEDIKEHIWGH
jgi:hypothetical protein